MGIQSTQTITRETAINRLSQVVELIVEKDYRGLEEITVESDFDIARFIDKTRRKEIDFNKWTNGMLTELIDMPFYRFSMFENYRINDDED